MTEMTWKALSHALVLQHTEIGQKGYLLSMIHGAQADALSRELQVLQDYEKELMWLVALYEPKTPEQVRENLAKSIYRNIEIPDKPEWVAGGTSELQEIARAAADKALENIRAEQVKTS